MRNATSQATGRKAYPPGVLGKAVFGRAPLRTGLGERRVTVGVRCLRVSPSPGYGRRTDAVGSPWALASFQNRTAKATYQTIRRNPPTPTRMGSTERYSGGPLRPPNRRGLS